LPLKSLESDKLQVPKEIHLYNASSTKTLDLDEIAGYLIEKLGCVEVDIRKGMFQHCLESHDIEELSTQLAQARVKNISKETQEFKPLYGEIQVEKRFLIDNKELPGVLYNGFKLHTIAARCIPQEERNFEHAHILLTDRLFGTFDENDLKYHARVIICGYPSLISTSGVVEAPAKPKEFYMLKRKYAAMGFENLPIEAVKKMFTEQFIDYDDLRLTEVLKGYVFQALFFHMTFEPFCDDMNCRLYNAHWQSDLLRAQLNSTYEFCREHTKIIEMISSRRFSAKE